MVNIESQTRKREYIVTIDIASRAGTAYPTDSSFSLSLTSLFKVNFGEASFGELGTESNAILKRGLPQLSLIPDSVTEVTLGENTLHSVIDASKVRSGEVSRVGSASPH